MLNALEKLVPDLQLVMFDLDGTLVDSVADLSLAVERMHLDLGMTPATQAQVRAWVGNGAAMLVKRALSYSLEGFDSEASASAKQIFDQAYALFLAHYDEVNGSTSECYDGARELLQTLRAEGVSVAIVTNKPEQFTLPLLELMSLSADLVLCGDSLPEKKPSPMPLLHALAHFSCEPERAVMVGDSMSDLKSASAAGVKCVAVSYGYNHGVSISDANPALLVDSLSELR